MNIFVEITNTDYKKFIGYYILHSKPLRLLAIIGFIIVLIIELIISKLNLVTMSIFLLIDLVLFALLFWQVISANSSEVLEGDPRLGYKEINITSDFLIVKENGISREIQRNHMTKFKEDRFSFYIYSTYADVIILPKRSFESEDKQEDFRKLIK